MYVLCYLMERSVDGRALRPHRQIDRQTGLVAVEVTSTDTTTPYSTHLDLPSLLNVKLGPYKMSIATTNSTEFFSVATAFLELFPITTLNTCEMVNSKKCGCLVAGARVSTRLILSHFINSFEIR